MNFGEIFSTRRNELNISLDKASRDLKIKIGLISDKKFPGCSNHG